MFCFRDDSYASTRACSAEKKRGGWGGQPPICIAVTWRGAKPRTPGFVLFCFGHMLPREFARLQQAGVLGGAQPPPFANTMLALGLLNCCLHPPQKAQQVLSLLNVLSCCPNPPQKAQQVLGLLNCCPNPPQKAQQVLRLLSCCPNPPQKAPQVSGLLNCCLNPPQNAQQVFRLLNCCPNPPKKAQLLGLLNCCLNPPQRPSKYYASVIAAQRPSTY